MRIQHAKKCEALHRTVQGEASHHFACLPAEAFEELLDNGAVRV